MTLIFAEDDFGIRYLRERLARRTARVTLRGRVTIEAIPEIDHPMYRAWLRPRIVEAIDRGAARDRRRLTGAHL